MPNRLSSRNMEGAFLLTFACLLASGCRSPRPQTASIEFTRLPPTGQGDSDILHVIEGRVKGARLGQKVVIFARSGVWWVQPLASQPFTPIQRDSTWKTSSHPGSAYAALLVDASYRPPTTVSVLPAKGGAVSAVMTAGGPDLDQALSKTLDFSGYRWKVGRTHKTPGGTPNDYDAANAWVDPDGYLHLRIQKTATGWKSAEIWLAHSLAYGSYRFLVRDISHLEPTVVLAIISLEVSAPNREMSIEISRWGESTGKNTQFVVQPYYVPANVVRFLSPPGRLMYSFDWSPGRLIFRTERVASRGSEARTIAAHTFSSGVAEPAGEEIHLNLYNFDDRRTHLRSGVEVIIEKFEYLP
jgi:hypothetical protein